MNTSHVSSSTARSWDAAQVVVTELLYPQLESLLRNIAPDSRQIVEFGSGDGDGTGLIRKVFAHSLIVGIDRDQESLEKCAQRHGSFFRGVRADFGNPINFEGPADLAISIQTLMWLDTPALQSLLRQVSDVLKSGGRFIGSMVHPAWISSKREPYGAVLQDGSRPYVSSWKDKVGVQWWRSLEDYETAFRAAGLLFSAREVYIPEPPPTHWDDRYRKSPGQPIFVIIEGRKCG